jgi:NitT/TauT family transport system substrate-binding protein
MGFFKQHGVEVEPVKYDNTSQAIPDLAGAKLDGGLFTMGDILLASNLTDIKGVMVSDNGGIYSIVATPDIQSVNDLRGKRIGLNLHTSSEMFVSYMLKSVNMNSSNVDYVEMGPQQVLQNIPDQVDAGLVWEPFTSQALQKGEKVVYQSTNYSTLIPKLIAFRTTVVKQRPEDIRAFILAWNDAVNYRISHPQESTAIISKATGLPTSDLNLTSNITIYTIDNNTQLFANNPGTDASSIYFIAGFNRDYLITIGYITNPPDINNMLDPSFLK